MTRRLLTAAGVGVLLTAAGLALAAAKPPDLPQDVQEPLAPLAEGAVPLPPPLPVDVAGNVIVPAVGVDGPEPVRPPLAASERRRVVGNLLFAAHPLLLLTQPYFPEPCDRGGDAGCPAARPWFRPAPVQPAEQPGLRLGLLMLPDDETATSGLACVVAESPREAEGCEEPACPKRTFVLPIPCPLALAVAFNWAVRTLEPAKPAEAVEGPAPECPDVEAPAPAAPQAPAPEVHCPFLQRPTGGKCVTEPTEAEVPVGIAELLDRLAAAEEVLRTAERLRGEGKVWDVFACWLEVHRLAPGSRVEEEMVSLLAEMCGKDGPSGSEEGCEPKEPVRPGVAKPGPGDEPVGECKPSARVGAGRCGQGLAQRAVKPRRRDVEKRLEQLVSVDYSVVPLRMVLEDLKSQSGLRIEVDHVALEEDGIDLGRPVSLAVERVPLKVVLEHLLSDCRLEYVVKADGLWVTSETRGVAKVHFVSYTVADLLKSDLLPGEGAPEEKLVRYIEETVAPGSWSSQGGPAAIDYYPATMSLLVNQTAPRHEAIRDLLNGLRQKQVEREARRAGVDIQVRHLLKACHLAMQDGRAAKAADLAREAYLLDPERVTADPLVYKLHLLAGKLPENATCPAHRPGEEPCEPPCRPDSTEPADQHGPCNPGPCPLGERSSPEPNLHSRCGGEDLHVEPPPVDPEVPEALQHLTDEQRAPASEMQLELGGEQEQEEDAPPTPVKEFDFDLEMPHFDLTIPELGAGESLPASFAAWSLRLAGVTCLDLSTHLGEWRVGGQVDVGGTIYRVRYDCGDLELSILPLMPLED